MAKKNTPQKQTLTSKPAAKAEKAAPVRTAFFSGGFWKRHWLPALLLVAASFGLYGTAIKYGYLLDDEMVIWKNAYVQEGIGGAGKIFGNDSFMGYFQKKEDLYRLEGGRYRPLSLVTFAAEISLFGKDKTEASAQEDPNDRRGKTESQGRGNPAVSHFINILLYGLNGILVYAILLGMFPMKEGQSWWWSVPFVGAAIFIFHPLHSECVANIKGRDEIMALMGSLGALYAFMRYFDTRKSWLLWLSAFLFLLGLLSKENTLTFLFVIPLTVWFFGRVPVGKVVSASLPLLAAAFVFIVIRYNALGYMLSHGKAGTDLMNDSFLGMTGTERLATIFLTLGWYIKLLFYPHPLTHDYYPYHVPKVTFSNIWALLSLVGYLGLGIWSVLNLKKRRIVAYAVLFFIATLSIVSNLVVSVGSFMNERFAYMPSVAFCLLAAWFLVEKLPALLPTQKAVATTIGTALLAVMLGGYAFLTITRVPDWENMLTLNGSAVISSPNSARAQSFYTTAVYQELYAKATTPEEKLRWVDTMEPHVKRALEIYPDYGSAWVMRANIAGARFDADHQMDRLFNEWTYCLEKKPYIPLMRSNIDTYMKYLATNGGNPNKICSFAYRIGYEYFYEQMKDPKSAAQFLEYGVMTRSAEPRLLLALAEMYDKLNNPQRAAEIRRMNQEMYGQ